MDLNNTKLLSPQSACDSSSELHHLLACVSENFWLSRSCLLHFLLLVSTHLWEYIKIILILSPVEATSGIKKKKKKILLPMRYDFKLVSSGEQI